MENIANKSKNAKAENRKLTQSMLKTIGRSKTFLEKETAEVPEH